MLDGEQNPSRRQVIGRVAGGLGIASVRDATPRVYHECDGSITPAFDVQGTQKAAEEATAIKARPVRKSWANRIYAIPRC